MGWRNPHLRSKKPWLNETMRFKLVFTRESNQNPEFLNGRKHGDGWCPLFARKTCVGPLFEGIYASTRVSTTAVCTVLGIVDMGKAGAGGLYFVGCFSV